MNDPVIISIIGTLGSVAGLLAAELARRNAAKAADLAHQNILELAKARAIIAELESDIREALALKRSTERKGDAA